MLNKILFFSCIGLLLIKGVNGQSSKPNIILIMADDLGYETLRCNGGTSYQTPNLDQLASNGIRFTNCYATPLCTPSRVTIMTGKYNFRNYTKFNEMDSHSFTFGNAMKAAGYKTFVAGKWQLQLEEDKEQPNKFGFDQYALWQLFKGGYYARYKNPSIYENGAPLKDTKNAYGPDIFSDKIISFIESNKEEPFFVYYPMVLTHEPFQPTPDNKEFKDYPVNQTNDTVNFKYMVSYMDKLVGRIVDRVESLGIAENTIIIFTGDNGTQDRIVSRMGDILVRGGKGSTTIPGTHVPLIAYWKGKTPIGKVYDDLIDFTDFFPTIAEAAKYTLPKNEIFDGNSFYGRLTGSKSKLREWIYCYYTQSGDVARAKRYAQDKNWKLYDTDAFYNIIEDPTEKHPIALKDLSPSVKQKRAKLQKAIEMMKSQEFQRK